MILPLASKSMPTNITPIPQSSEIKKVVLFNYNGDGTLSPSSLVSSGSGTGKPLATSAEVIKGALFTLNADGTLSPKSV
jgi:hypothetical protein